MSSSSTPPPSITHSISLYFSACPSKAPFVAKTAAQLCASRAAFIRPTSGDGTPHNQRFPGGDGGVAPRSPGPTGHGTARTRSWNRFFIFFFSTVSSLLNIIRAGVVLVDHYTTVDPKKRKKKVLSPTRPVRVSRSHSDIHKHFFFFFRFSLFVTYI